MKRVFEAKRWHLLAGASHEPPTPLATPFFLPPRGICPSGDTGNTTLKLEEIESTWLFVFVKFFVASHAWNLRFRKLQFSLPVAAPVQEAVVVMAVIMAVPAGLRLMLGLEGIRL